MFGKPAKTVRRARAQRRTMSLPEVLLWRHLRASPGGFKFRRQHPAGPFVLDFYCAAVRLCVEVDGSVHERGDQPAFDTKRDALLAENGIVTLRIPAREVLDDIGSVLDYIVEHAGRLPLHRPAGGPPPQAKLGED